MSKKSILTSVLILGLLILAGSLSAAESKKAKNIILMIGDGMGVNCDAAGTFYRYGKPGSQKYHQFRFLLSATFSLTEKDFNEKKETGYLPEKFWTDLTGAGGHSSKTTVTDSAASGTALNWGQKTTNGRIGCDFSGKPVKLFSEYAADAGKSIGAVSSVQIANATPAAVMAHQFQRSLLNEISREQILDQDRLTVLMGTGHPYYNNGIKMDKPGSYSNVGGKTVWEEIYKKQNFAGVKLIDEKESFVKLAKATPDRKVKLPKRILGVVRSNGDVFPIDGFPDGDENNEVYRNCIGKNAEAICKGVPTLTEMSVGALNVLARNPKGFYLMIEGGAIDHANHGNNIKLSVLEHTAFAKAIDAVIDWVEKYSSWDETLLIITADHETGQLWGADTYDDKNANNHPDKGEKFNGFKHVVNNGKGVIPGTVYATGGHTNALVPVWIHGAGSDNIDKFIRGKDLKAAEFYKEYGYNFDGSFIFNSDVPKIEKAASGLGK